MKKIAIITGIAALSFGAVIACSSSGDKNTATATATATTIESTTPQPIGVTALPSLAMTDAQGNAVDLQSFKGKKVFVNL